MTTRSRVYLPVLILIAAGAVVFLLWEPQLASGQEDNIRNQPPCSCCCAENDITHTFNLFNQDDPRSKKCWGLDRTGEGCRKTLGSLPEGEVQAICNKYQRLAAFPFARTFGDCPVLKPFCKPKCQELAPWFDSAPQSGCKDVQKWKIEVEEGVVYLRMCGWGVFAYTLPDSDPLLRQAYIAALREHVQTRIGDRICCDKFLAAAKPNSSCDPRLDFDCDGDLNPSDRTPDGQFPDITTFGVDQGAIGGGRVDAPPVWFPSTNPGFAPPSNLCACKWELITATRTCSQGRGQKHVYQTSWRCPSSGNIKSIRREMPATEPCTPPPPKDGGWFKP